MNSSVGDIGCCRVRKGILRGLLMVTVMVLGGVDGMAKETSVTITSSADNTIYSGPDNESKSNGAGDHVFAGATNRPSVFGARRALLKFDVGSSVPMGSRVTSASLRLNLSKTRSEEVAATVSLHRVLPDWGETASLAGVPRPSLRDVSVLF